MLYQQQTPCEELGIATQEEVEESADLNEQRMDPSDGKAESKAKRASKEIRQASKQVKAASKPKEAADKPPIDKCTGSQPGTGAEMQAANRRPVLRGKFKQGQLVEARFDGENKWYPGTVTKALGKRSYALAYDNGDAEDSVAEVMIRLRTEKKPESDFSVTKTVRQRSRSLPGSLPPRGTAIDASAPLKEATSLVHKTREQPFAGVNGSSSSFDAKVRKRLNVLYQL